MDKLKVAAVSVRNLVDQAENSIADMQKWIEVAAVQGAELTLFPELNIGGHIRAPIVRQISETIPGPSTERITALAEQYRMVIAFGILERDQDDIFCTHVLVNGSGVIGTQRKIHVPTQESPFWCAGNSIDVFDIGRAKVGITICRDSFFGEMTRTLYSRGAEVILMPFGYYNVPRSEYMRETIHGMSIIQASWTNGFFSVVCNSAESREANEWEKQGRTFPGWAGIVSPWGRVIEFVDIDGNNESIVVQELDPAELEDRRQHPNFLAAELRPELYQFT